MEQYKQKAALLSTLQTEQANMAQSAAQYQQAFRISGARVPNLKKRWAKTK